MNSFSFSFSKNNLGLGIPVYLLIFILSQIYQVFTAWDAVSKLQKREHVH